MKDVDTLIGGSEVRYPSTVWSSVTIEPDRERLGRVLARYWKPIYRTIRVGWRKNNEDAKDLTQAFLLRILEDDFFSQFSPEMARFRTFLKAALTHFLANEEKARERLKRGGGRRGVPLDDHPDAPELETGGSPDAILDREWADALLEEGIDELRKRLRTQEKESWFRVYEAIDLGAGPMTYREAAMELGMTESDVTHALHNARRLLRSILIEQIGEYARGEEELYDELHAIYSS